jgi:ABC-type tungstate transport system substrate-binding protein
LTFVFLSDTLVKNYKKRKEEKKEKQQTEVPSKKFTRKNKLIVTIKKRFGIIGISLATPLLLSIPLGCFLAVRYFKNKQEIIAYMFGSILFWSVSIASFKLLF